jgi:TldD protein
MINPAMIEKLLDQALSTGADFAEIFCEESRRSQLSMANGEIDKAMSGLDSGLGLRLWQGERCLYTFSNDLTEDSLFELVRVTAAALADPRQETARNLERQLVRSSHPWQIRPSTVAKPEIVRKLRSASDSARAVDSLISQTRASLATSENQILIANSQGLLVEDERLYCRFAIETVASSETEKQTGFTAPGARRGYEWFQELDCDQLAVQAATTAVTMLKAELCPSGQMPVIIDNGFGGVIFHEACGHSLEATSLARKASVFQDKQGQQIASPLVTAVDDATLPHEWGSRDIDDEGTPTRQIVLIKDGILQDYMVDRHNGRKLGLESTGSARRESYRYAPTSRMSNTYIAAGKHDPADIIKSTPSGLYARTMGGGSVDPASGEFNFSVLEAYLVRDGQIAEPVRGATLIGKGADILMKIDQVGNNMKMAQGMCGSVSGSVPANVGQPMIRVSQMTVGGRRG